MKAVVEGVPVTESPAYVFWWAIHKHGIPFSVIGGMIESVGGSWGLDDNKGVLIAWVFPVPPTNEEFRKAGYTDVALQHPLTWSEFVEKCRWNGVSTDLAPMSWCFSPGAWYKEFWRKKVDAWLPADDAEDEDGPLEGEMSDGSIERVEFSFEEYVDHDMVHYAWRNEKGEVVSPVRVRRLDGR